MSGAQDILRVTALAFEAEQAKHLAFRRTEARLRADLARLDRELRDTLRAPPEELLALRSIGGDLAWRSHCETRRAALLRDLALHLAGREAVLRGLRQAHGRHLAAQAIANKAEAAAAKEAARRAEIGFQELLGLAGRAQRS